MEQQKDMAPKRITRDLPVKLTEAEMANVAREIGRLNKDKQTMEAQAKVSASQWKDRIGGIEALIADLATKANEGVEPRPVACEEHHDYRRHEVRVVRVDTGEQLEVRPMTQDERQPKLPIATDAATVKGEAKAKGDAAADPDAPPPAPKAKA